MSNFKKRKIKNNGWIKFFFIIIFCIILFTVIFFVYSQHTYNKDLKKTVFEISGNSKPQIIEISGSIPIIAKYLEDKKIIPSSSSFIKYIKKHNLDTKIQAGKNKISPTMTIPEIAKKLTKAFVPTITVRIPEGYTLQEVDTYLSEKNFFKKNEFLECIEKKCTFSKSKFSFLPKNRNNWEGYFFPATYTLKADTFSTQNLAEEMLWGFIINSKKLGVFDNKKRKLSDLVIMASLIEKESSTYKGNESAMISDILWKRIDEGIPLGVDATLRYGLGIKNDALTIKDLNQKSSFNTRKNKGLPPHAISNFSAHSLQAATYPKKNPFYFYLHYNGKIHYGKTNAEHEYNKQKYCGWKCE